MERQRAGNGVSRRGFLGAMSIGLGAVAATAFADPARAVNGAVTPKLPGEYWRRNGLTTRYAGTLFDDIAIKVNGDAARLFVPQSLSSTAPATVVWLYHGAGSDHNAIIGGFVTTAERAVDEGAVVICQNAGGTLYSHPTAQALQVAAYQQLAGFFPIGSNILRATSAGGALAAETYAAGLIPNISGYYSMNAIYDLEALYQDDPRAKASMDSLFGSMAAIRAANPTRHATTAWQGKKVRVGVSTPESSDTVVPPSKHGLALIAKASPVAAEASVRTHTNGHATPSWADDDFIDALLRWRPTRDTTPPTVSITSPAMGASLSGWVTVAIAAADAGGIAGVSLTVDGKDAGPATYAGGRWIVTLNSGAYTNDRHLLRAVATDAAGNSTTSAWVAVRFANSAPVVAIAAPTAGSTVSGVVTLSADAAAPAGVNKVTFSSGTRKIGDGTLSGGLWNLRFDTRSALTPNGSYPLVATAVDRNGASTASSPVTITIRN